MIDGAGVTVDADSLIYFVERHPRYFPVLEPVFARVAAGTIDVHASTLTMLEVLVAPLRDGRESLAAAYGNLFVRSGGLILHPVDLAVAERAASLRAAWNLRTPDSVVAATALECQSYLLTNDAGFRRVPDLRILLVEDFA